VTGARRRSFAWALGLVALAACSTTPSLAIPTCSTETSGDPLILLAQSVPSAAFVPCIQEFPAGWSFGGMNIETGRSEFWLYSDRAGERAVTVLLTEGCDVSGAVEMPTDADEAGLARYDEPRVLPPRFVGDRYYVFPGGCITYRFAFTRDASFGEVVEAAEALSFISRAEGVEELRKEGLELCGAGVDCPG
jgi:hypothetical protein